MLTDRQILEVRSHFPLLREKTWLYNCSQGALWGAVDGTLKDYSQSWRRAMDPWRDWVGAYEALRAGFARFIGAKPDEIAVVTSASAGINPIANAIEDRGQKTGVQSPVSPSVSEMPLFRDAFCSESIGHYEGRGPTSLPKLRISFPRPRCRTPEQYLWCPSVLRHRSGEPRSHRGSCLRQSE